MSYQDAEFELNIQRIKELLPQFVMDHAEKVTVSQNGQIMFCCLNPDHPDTNPSMGINPNFPWVAHCFSCQANYNVFHLNTIINGAPSQGLEFIEKNANNLALTYGAEPIDTGNISEAYLAKLKVFTIIDGAFSTLASAKEEDGVVTFKYAKLNGLTEKTCREFGVGTVLDYKKFVNQVRKLTNCTDHDLITALGYEWSMFFSKTKITYTLFNNKGQPCSFACRNLDYDGNFGVLKNQAGKIPKWYNGATTIIFNKDEELYGFYHIKKSKETVVYMFEGQNDVLVAYQNGIKNAFCKGGTGSLKPRDVRLLKDVGVDVVIIALDNDKAGLLATDATLKTGFTEVSGVKPKVLLVPHSPKQDGSGQMDTDPDNYIITYGRDEFLSLRPMTAFGYTAMRAKNETDENNSPLDLNDPEVKAQFLDRFMPLILQESSSIVQEEMRKEIANILKVSPSTIRETQTRLESRADLETRNTVRKYFTRFQREFYDTIDLNPTSIIDKVEEFYNFVSESSDPLSTNKLGNQEQIDALNSFFVDLQDSDIENQFWKTGWPLWDMYIGGIKKTGNFTGILAPQNIGKSNMLMNIALRLCAHNNTDDLLVLYWTIDDPRKDIFLKFLCIMTNIDIQDVSNFANLGASQKNAIMKEKAILEKWIKDDQCLSIKDQAIGVSAADLTRWVQYEQDKHPTKKIVLIIDNFGNMESGAGDELQNQIRNVNRLHSFRVMNDMAILASMELNKETSAGKSTSKGISGSQKIAYRLTMALSLYNELDDRKNQDNEPEKSKRYWLDLQNNMRPIIEVNILKLKMTTKRYFRESWFGRLNNTSFVIDEIGDKHDYERFGMDQAQDKHKIKKWEFCAKKASSSLPVKDPFKTDDLTDNNGKQNTESNVQDIINNNLCP